MIFMVFELKVLILLFSAVADLGLKIRLISCQFNILLGFGAAG